VGSGVLQGGVAFERSPASLDYRSGATASHTPKTYQPHPHHHHPPSPTPQPTQELQLSNLPDLDSLPGLPHLTALTALTLHATPAAAHPSSTPMAALSRLPQLTALAITGAPTLHRLPSGASELTALTGLVLDVTMRDRGEEGPEPEDYAPLGRGGGGDAGRLRCWGLRRLVVRGFGGPLHLPGGMERFTRLEELDLGGRQELWNLGPWLLRLHALRKVVVPRRSAQQSLFEALALRNDPHQVDVEEEDGVGGDEGSDGGWGREDGEGWASEGF